MYIDSHAHITEEGIYTDYGEILQRAQASAVHAIVNICTDEISLKRGVEICKQYCWVFNTAATTPHDVEKEGASFFPLVAQAAASGQLIAIGETGLDYHYNYSPKVLQMQYLEKYMALAVENKLPLIFHCREAFQDLVAMADRHCPGHPAVLHCFTGTLEEAQLCLDRGWFISISGIVTFKKSTTLRKIVEELPIDRLLIETDAPYLAPESKRGRRNEPGYIGEVAACIAACKNISLDLVATQTAQNAQQVFGILPEKILLKS